MKIKWQGLETVQRNLNKQIKKIRFRSSKGMIKAGLHVRRESQKLTPVVTGNLRNSCYVVWKIIKDNYVVVEEAFRSGTFKQNVFGDIDIQKLEDDREKAVSEAVSEVTKDKMPSVIIGYSANYAPFVHENPRAGKTEGISPKGKEYLPPKGSKRKVFSTVGQYKFLEQPMITERKRILEIIKQDAKI